MAEQIQRIKGNEALLGPELEKATAEKSTSLPADFETSKAGLEGWRFWLTMAGLYTSAFLVTLEMTVVSTALVAITDDLHDFRHSTWIVNAYFLAWTAFIVLWAQFSHNIGRKSSLLIALGLFIVFSAACAAAQTAVQLFIFRALQGMTGAGAFILPIVIMTEAVSPSAVPICAGLNSVVSLIAFVAGPIIGGTIAARASWRWVFILDIPPGCLAFFADLIALPRSFPNHRKPLSERPRFSFTSLGRLDAVGGILFLAFSVMLVTALQEAEASFTWQSATIICLLAFSGLSGVLFVCWERHITVHSRCVTPVMTWSFLQRRTIAIFTTSFLIGVPFVTVLVQIPQRLQIVDGMSALQAGLHLLPYITLVPVGGILAAFWNRRFQKTPIYGQALGVMLQLIAIICFNVDALPSYPQKTLPSRQYVFQAIMGLGNGFSYTVNLSSIPYAVGGRKELVAPAMGANLQFRYLGATIGLGIVTAAFNTYVRSNLVLLLSEDEVQSILQTSSSVLALQPGLQERVTSIISSGFQLQWKIIAGSIGLQIATTLLTY